VLTNAPPPTTWGAALPTSLEEFSVRTLHKPGIPVTDVTGTRHPVKHLATVVAAVEFSRVSLAKPASSATEGGSQAQVSAERPACFREVDPAMSAWFGRVLWVGWVLTGPDCQVCPVAPAFGSAVSAWFGRAPLVDWVLTRPGFQACSVALEFGSAVSVSSD
jgi:hypothetical protein